MDSPQINQIPHLWNPEILMQAYFNSGLPDFVFKEQQHYKVATELWDFDSSVLVGIHKVIICSQVMSVYMAATLKFLWKKCQMQME